jgi:putative hydrolase
VLQEGRGRTSPPRASPGDRLTDRAAATDGKQGALRALERIAYLLERNGDPSYRVRAFRNAAAVVRDLAPEELTRHVRDGTLTRFAGIGPSTAKVIADAERGDTVEYLMRLEASHEQAVDPAAYALRNAIRGDCHVHSDWSDGGSPIDAMARAARDMGHEYIVLTDHSPTLTVAHGLSPERLREQLDVVAGLNQAMAPFRILTGIEVDILEDGSLDQEPELLASLDVVVASVHSKLRSPADEMTPRMLEAITNSRMNILGHCTGRIVVGRGRPESTFDAERVFNACRQHGVAVEVNSRLERQDPPKRLLRLALELGCDLAIDTDAHAPGQLEWLLHGCERAAVCGAAPDRVVNTRAASDLVHWAARPGDRRSGRITGR